MNRSGSFHSIPPVYQRQNTGRYTAMSRKQPLRRVLFTLHQYPGIALNFVVAIDKSIYYGKISTACAHATRRGILTRPLQTEKGELRRPQYRRAWVSRKP